MYNRRIRGKALFLRCFFLILLGIFIISITACGSYKITNVDNHYNLITIKQSVGKFSFEYSNNYKVTKVEIKSTYTDLNLDGPEVGENQDIPFISIFTQKLNDGEYGYENDLKEELNSAKNTTDYQILEQFPVSLLGESGEEVAYYYMWKPPLGFTNDKPKPMVVRFLMFTHNNLLWRLEVNSVQSYSDSAKADFNHVVQTFKILN